MATILLCGHSHVGAISYGYKTEIDQGHRFPFNLHTVLINQGNYIVITDNKAHYHPDSEARLQAALEAIRPDAVAFSLQGEQAAWISLTPPERPYDFFFPGEPSTDAAGQAEVVPFDAIMALYRPYHQMAADFLDRQASNLTMPVIGISPPPLVGDAEFVLSNLQNYGAIATKLQEHGGLPPKAWREKIWRLHAMVLADIYRSRGHRFIAPPEGTVGADGCMIRSFYSDVFHANEAYGKRVLMQLAELVT